jgi:[ribosomal protein S5]-alanine N-acetyltransferase
VQLGYFLGESEWGRGLGTEFVGALVAWLAARGPLRLTAYTDSDNLASAKVLEKSGFVRQEAASSTERFCFALTRG